MSEQKAAELVKAAEPATPKPFAPKNFNQTEQVQRGYTIFVPVGTTTEEIETPEMWCHNALQMTKNSIIKIYTEDYSHYWEAIVTDQGKAAASLWAVVDSPRKQERIAKAAKDLFKIYRIDNAASGYRVIHKATGDVLSDGHSSQAAAITAMAALDKAA